jgi:hypothetical protein
MPPGKSHQVLPDLLYRVGEDVAGWDAEPTNKGLRRLDDLSGGFCFRRLNYLLRLLHYFLRLGFGEGEERFSVAIPVSWEASLRVCAEGFLTRAMIP